MIGAKVNGAEVGKAIRDVALGYHFQFAMYPKYGHDLSNSNPLACCL